MTIIRVSQRIQIKYTINYYVEIRCQLDATDDIYCRSYCMLNMFRAIPRPSSGAREHYTDGRCLWCLVLWFSGCRYGVELKVMCPVCSLQTGHITLENQAPNSTGSNHLYNTLELLMMGIMVPETCWASNKICNKNHLLRLVGILLPHNDDDARSKSLQIYTINCWSAEVKPFDVMVNSIGTACCNAVFVYVLLQQVKFKLLLKK